MAEPRTTHHVDLLTCPACKAKVQATLTLELELGPLEHLEDAAQLPATAKVVGLRVQHDCTPTLTRGRGGHGGARGDLDDERGKQHQSRG